MVNVGDAGIEISIHAPVKGATSFPRQSEIPKQHFNPRSREGSDPSTLSLSAAECISIHAPVKGATHVTGV